MGQYAGKQRARTQRQSVDSGSVAQEDCVRGYASSKSKKKRGELPLGWKITRVVIVAVLAVSAIVLLSSKIAGFDTIPDMFAFIRDSIAAG